MKNTIIKTGIGYKVYFHDSRYYVDIGKPIIHSFKTLKGVAEMLYYLGYIDSKNTNAI